MSFITTITYEDITDLIFEAKVRLCLSLPGITLEIAQSLKEHPFPFIIKLVIDNSESTIRSGYGDIEAIEILRQRGVQINECQGNFVSFIISDNIAYYLFPQSRIFVDEPPGPNAARIDPSTIQMLILNYFPSTFEEHNLFSDSSEILLDTLDHIKKELHQVTENGPSISSTSLNLSTLTNITHNLKINPHVEPNIQRMIRTYNAKVQYVEFSFKGGDFENKIAKLPNNAIPVNNPALKALLLTRIKMFSGIKDSEEYKNFTDFKKEFDVFRDKYTKPITNRPGKRILKSADKEQFKKEFKSFQDNAKKFDKVLEDVLNKTILDTIDALKKELSDFFQKNEPPEVSNISNPDIKRRKIENLIHGLVSDINFPDITKLISKIAININFYDLTWSDFSDEKLLEEFKKKEIMSNDDINDIVEFKKAFDVKK